MSGMSFPNPTTKIIKNYDNTLYLYKFYFSDLHFQPLSIPFWLNIVL